MNLVTSPLLTPVFPVREFRRVSQRHSEELEEGKMKTKVQILFAVFGLMPVLALPAAAQTFRLNADIPFAFTVQGKTLPAGEYTIASNGSEEYMELRNVQSKEGVLAIGMPVGSSKTLEVAASKLVFQRYNDRYFLAEVWDGSDAIGRELNTSAEERAVAKETAGVKPEIVVILAMR
jgi:hypothetical protein